MTNSTTRRPQRHSLSGRVSADRVDQGGSFSRGRRTTSVGKITQFFQTNHMRERAANNYFQSALQDLAMTSKLATQMAETQRRGAETLARWAQNAHNAAIEDVMQQTSQLFHMYSERQLQFAREYSHFLQQLKKITEAERAVKEAERQVAVLDEKEKKLKREIRKGPSFFRQRRGGDICLLRQQLDEVKTSKESAERALSDVRAEMEVVKMFRFRHGMQGIADSYRNLAQSCQAIFNCHREITEMVPAVSNQDVRRMMYDGVSVTRNRVEDLRRSLQGFNISTTATNSASRRRSEPMRRPQVPHHSTPPPPYSPTAPPQSPPRVLQRPHVSDTHILKYRVPPSASNLSPQNQNRQSVESTPSPRSECNTSRPSPARDTQQTCSHCGRMFPEFSPNLYKYAYRTETAA